MTGDNHLFHATDLDIHINLDGNEELEKFDDNVNSAFCSCVNPVWIQPQFRQLKASLYQKPRYYYQSNPYQNRGSFVGEPVIKRYSFKVL